MSNTYNLFVSHSWSYGDAYEKFCKLLDEASYFSYKNYSVPKDDPIHNAPNETLLFEAIKTQILPCHIVIIMAGKYATYSKWIQKEIKIAQEEFSYGSKPILAVTPWGSDQISSIVRQKADKIVGWNSSSIISGIRDLIT